MFVFFFFKQKTAYEMRISDWSSDVCSSDLNRSALIAVAAEGADNPSRGLAITGNRASLSPETSWPSVFVADWSGESLAIGANDQIGRAACRERVCQYV